MIEMSRLLSRIMLSAALLAVAACGGKAVDPDEPSNAGGGPSGRPAAVVDGTLVAVTQGDVACYVTITDDAGVDKTHLGTFEVCPESGSDADALIGQRVVLTFERGNVLADSCEGQPDCADSQQVDLVNSITAVP